MTHRIGFIGLGMMGGPMAKRLLHAGLRFSVHNRTKSKAEPLIAEGAHWCDSPQAVAANSDIVFSMVSNPDALRDVVLGSAGVLAGLKPGAIHIDTSTVSPEVIHDILEAYSPRGSSLLHAPVLGSVPQATDGTLLMFAGGDDAAFQIAEPYLRLLTSRIWRFERPEQATHLKLICNLFIAGMIATLGEALAFARNADVDQSTLLEIIGKSQLNSPMYQTKGASIIQDNFAPRFFLDHMLKDVNLMIEAGRSLQTPLPTIELVQQMLVEAQRSGLGHEDYSAVVKVLFKKGN